jgi:hypothetical protein
MHHRNRVLPEGDRYQQAGTRETRLGGSSSGREEGADQRGEEFV